MTPPLTVYIGYDSREPVTFAVLVHSILSRASVPHAIVPLTLQSVAGVFHRARGPLESTEFAYTRFLVPYLSKYRGFSLFMDSDMLVQTDLVEVWSHILKDHSKAVYVCPHDYVPKTTTKFLGQPQTAYPRKNWSSFVLWNNAQCTALTPEYVNTATGAELHRFQWLQDEQIGYLPLEWNWLVGEYPPNQSAKNLHFTLGAPCFPEYAGSDHADRWFAERDALLGASDRVVL